MGTRTLECIPWDSSFCCFDFGQKSHGVFAQAKRGADELKKHTERAGAVVVYP